MSPLHKVGYNYYSVPVRQSFTLQLPLDVCGAIPNKRVPSLSSVISIAAFHIFQTHTQLDKRSLNSPQRQREGGFGVRGLWLRALKSRWWNPGAKESCFVAPRRPEYLQAQYIPSSISDPYKFGPQQFEVDSRLIRSCIMSEIREIGTAPLQRTQRAEVNWAYWCIDMWRTLWRQSNNHDSYLLISWSRLIQYITKPI